MANMVVGGRRPCSSCNACIALGRLLCSRTREVDCFQLGKSDLLLLEGKGEEEEEEQIWELLEDGNVGSLPLAKGLNASWWEWSQGFALFFWGWHVTQRKAARNGTEIFVQVNLPSKLSFGRGT